MDEHAGSWIIGFSFYLRGVFGFVQFHSLDRTS
jgi:hypothetical protein